ncbi:hypothetical protein ABH979_000617 [Bradyrhizobium ottawaense]
MKIESYWAREEPFWKSGAAGAADQQRVAGEDAVAHQVGIGIVGVAGRVHHVERQALDRHLVAVGDPHRHNVGLGLVAHHGHAMGAVAQLAEAGDVVGMQMGVDRLDQLEVELAQQLAVAIDLLQHGIEDQRLAAGAAGKDVAVGARNAVEELAEDHGRTRHGTDCKFYYATGRKEKQITVLGGKYGILFCITRCRPGEGRDP